MTSLLVNLAFLALCLNVDLPPRSSRWREPRASPPRCSSSRSPPASRSCRCCSASSLLVGVIRPADGGSAGSRPAGALRERAPGRGAARPSSRRSCGATRAAARAAPTAPACSRPLPECRREWRGAFAAGAPGWRSTAWCARRRRRRPSASRRSSPRSTPRCCASAAAATRASRIRSGSTPGAGSRPPPRRWRRRSRAADYPGASVPPALRRPRRRARRPGARRRRDAREPRLARQREPARARPLAPPVQQMLIPARQVMRRNPWSGVAGCIYFGGEAAAAGAAACLRSPRRAAPSGGSAPCPRWRGPRPERVRRRRAAPLRRRPRVLAGEPGLADAARRQPLERAAVAAGDAAAARGAAPADRRALSPADRGPARPHRPRPTIRARRRTASSSTAAAVDVGFSIDLTIDPALQALAQKTAACYTGRHDVCRALGLHRQADDGRSRSASRCSKARWCAWRRWR